MKEHIIFKKAAEFSGLIRAAVITIPLIVIVYLASYWFGIRGEKSEWIESIFTLFIWQHGRQLLFTAVGLYLVFGVLVRKRLLEVMGERFPVKNLLILSMTTFIVISTIYVWNFTATWAGNIKPPNVEESKYRTLQTKDIILGWHSYWVAYRSSSSIEELRDFYDNYPGVRTTEVGFRLHKVEKPLAVHSGVRDEFWEAEYIAQGHVDAKSGSNFYVITINSSPEGSWVILSISK